MESTVSRPNEPWLAATWSFILPGAGQFYAGAARRGALWLAGGAILLVLGLGLLFHPSGPMLWGVGVMGGFFVVLALCMFDAHRTAARKNSPEFETTRQTMKDPWLAVFLSILLPGLGHLYLRRWLWGAGFLVAGLASTACVPEGLPRYVVRDAWVIVAAYNARRLSQRRTEGGHRAVLLVCATAVALHAASFAGVYGYYVGSFRVPGRSMSPTLEAGDRVLARRLGSHSLRRGDMVVVDLEPLHYEGWETPAKAWTLIKRVAAVEGDTIELSPEGFRINGQSLAAPPAAADGDSFVRIKKPVEYPYRMPQGQVFIVGDNLANSYDSRICGPVPSASVKGLVSKIIWPPSRSGPILRERNSFLVRWNRD